jgi:hypothetical protein
MGRYLSAGGDLVGVGLLVGGLVLLRSLECLFSLGLVGSPPLFSQLLEGGCLFSISLFFLLLSFGLGWHNFLSWHLHHKIIKYYNIVSIK